jgi:hypothetical protein
MTVSCGTSGGNEFRPFFRFTTVNVPQGATIISAFLNVCCAGVYGDTITFRTYMNDVDSAAQPASYSDISGAALTTDYGEYLSSDLSADSWAQLDITDAVQNVVDRAGWAANGAMMALLDYVGSANGTFQVYTYNLDTSYRASLYIQYTT